ncbi:hypothetical protein NECID01_2052 [Nematocida sp. AWRm77]|nr:hypothetical protein NECID01_2052 [Nematocida sp. AWRm77]
MSHYEHISLYAQKPLKEIYFVAGAAYLVGVVAGGVQGVVHSLRKTRGKPNGMAYMAASMGGSLGRAAALSAATILAGRYATNVNRMLGRTG